MRTIGAALLALAIALPLATATEAKKCPKDCDCAKRAVLNFGVDMDKIRPNPAGDLENWRLYAFLEKWTDLPERLESAVWHGSAAGGIAGALIVGCLLLVTAQRRKPT